MEYFPTFDGLQLAYRDEGSGLPLICLAGLTRSSNDFDYVAPYLSDNRLVRLDYRGRGKSEWATDPAQYSISTELQDILALMDHLEIEKAAVLGTSRGGIIAMAMAAIAKDRLIGVCLNDIGPEIASPGIANIMDYLGRNPNFATQQDMASEMAEIMSTFANVPDSRWLEEVQRHTVQTAKGLTITYDPKLRDAVIATSTQPAPDMWPMFDAMDDLPIALVRGANSDLLAPQTAAEMRRRRPDLLFAEIPDRGHIPFLDETGSVETLKNWLRNCA